MAKLTNLSKGLIAMALLCGMGSSAFFIVTNFIIDDKSSTGGDDG